MSIVRSSSATILVVDDVQMNRKLLEAMLKPAGYLTLSAASGPEALEIVAQHPVDLILLDIMMPGMNGYEVTARLKSNSATAQIPVIMVTALDDKGARLKGLEAGATEFLSKPVDQAELSIRVRNLLRLKEYADFLADHNRLLEQQVSERTEELRSSYIETIFTMTRAAEYKDEDTGLHVRRISFYCKNMAESLKMDPAFVENIFYASPMHDIGKIAIPDAVLMKPGGLTADEWKIMKTHSAMGAMILGQGNSPYLAMGVEIALNHHERWDGGGYPNGLAGASIPLSARIMNICDVYDALRSERPYKDAWSHEKALQIITEGDGRTQPEQFDPAVMAAFKTSAECFRDIYREQTD